MNQEKCLSTSESLNWKVVMHLSLSLYLSHSLSLSLSLSLSHSICLTHAISINIYVLNVIRIVSVWFRLCSLFMNTQMAVIRLPVCRQLIDSKLVRFSMRDQAILIHKHVFVIFFVSQDWAECVSRLRYPHWRQSDDQVPSSKRSAEVFQRPGSTPAVCCGPQHHRPHRSAPEKGHWSCHCDWMPECVPQPAHCVLCWKVCVSLSSKVNLFFSLMEYWACTQDAFFPNQAS